MAKLPSALLPGRAPSCLGCGSALRAPTLHPLLSATFSAPRRPSLASTAATAAAAAASQVRHATLIRRPQRPYTFTQLVQLSDGSTYTARTTSPHGTYRSVKDTRNHARWQPSDRSLRNVEVDEAGKLAAFRDRYGRGWDAAAAPPDDSMNAEEREKAQKELDAQEELDLTALIQGYASAAGIEGQSGMNAKETAKAERKNAKKGKK
ncbi:hypothetical protein GGTG_10848 [Gaeumannomyces tritici R3-111a-1]|uniref:Ribosomal protein bL31m N-terminal domain-containing protein n=1 Tax=Gaeumannomyces tritici (strain R3-111a-1) TaxID=644352 RepID=J3PBH6_GAET3|nr:hypothetical protein GGTG_10848 [Gaeumannomyces tritici R3-111a-1]EJT71593.1 hypothetical protein GGTG_10848 [Gaeumannomyces tritici R3-111a-1]